MKLALFFTFSMSLEKWDKIGSLSREVKPYQILAKKIGQVYLFTYGSKIDLSFSSILGENIIIRPKRIRIPNCLYSLLMPFFYWKDLKNIDFLKTNQMAGAMPAVIAKLIFKKKLIVRNGYEWLKVLENAKKSKWKIGIVYYWEKLAYKLGDIIFFTSQKDKDFAKAKFKIAEKKIFLVPNYIDIEIFKPNGLSREKNRIIFVGRISKEKNLFNLIEALSDLPTKLVVAGEGDLKAKLEAFAKKKSVNVEFLGSLANNKLPEEFNKSEIFILPSFYEGCPKALLEAMACSCLCVGTNVEGINEIIKDGVNGFLSQTDSRSIKAVVLKALGLPQLEKEQIQQEGRKTILNKFSLEKILNQEYEILEKFGEKLS